MSKICQSCGAQLDDTYGICPYCGSSALSDNANAGTPYFTNQQPNGNFNPQPNMYYGEQQPMQNQNQNPYPYYQMPVGANYQPPKKKGLKAWHIVCIVLAVIFAIVVFLGVLGSILAYNKRNTDDYYNNIDPDDFSLSLPDDDDDDDNNDDHNFYDYTKGRIEGNYYINEWANIKFEITDRWPNGNENAYSIIEDEKTECGFASIDDLSGTQMLLGFENIESKFVTYDETKYLDTVLSYMFDDPNFQNFEKSEYYDYIIAGETYLAVDCSYMGQVVERVYARIYDNHAIVFITASLDETAIDFINSIEPCR